MEKKRVAVYCRVSTLSEMQDSSFETQRDAYIQLIAGRDDLVLAGVYGDHGKSGTSMKHRTEFQRMLRDCEAGKSDLIMTKSISRFSRNILDCRTCVEKLREKGISVRFEREKIDSLTPACSMMFSLLAAIAQDESRSISDRETCDKAQAILHKRERTKEAGIERQRADAHFLCGKLFCAQCSAPYRRRTFKECRARGGENYKAWCCKERGKGKAGNGCTNPILREELLLRQISFQLGWAWNGTDGFDQTRFLQEVERVEVLPDGEIILQRSAQAA